MTRNYELHCLDLYFCQHRPEIPICDADGIVVEWRCRCGRIVPTRNNQEDTHVRNEQQRGLEGRPLGGRRT